MSKKSNIKEALEIKYTPRKMQLATILSDLNSLRASDAQAARALVSARPSPNATGSNDGKDTATKTSGNDGVNMDLLDDYRGDQDLERAFKLSQLHQRVKLAYVSPDNDGADGGDKTGGALAELQESRASVRLATRAFGFEIVQTTQESEAEIEETRHQSSGAVIDGEDDEDDEDDVEVAAWS